MCFCVIKDLTDGISCEFCRFGLLLCDGVDCCEYGAVYSPSILQQCSNNLRFFFFILVKLRGGVIIWRILYSGYVLRSSALMKSVIIAKG